VFLRPLLHQPRDLLGGLIARQQRVDLVGGPGPLQIVDQLVDRLLGLALAGRADAADVVATSPGCELRAGILADQLASRGTGCEVRGAWILRGRS